MAGGFNGQRRRSERTDSLKRSEKEVGVRSCLEPGLTEKVAHEFAHIVHDLATASKA